MTSQPSQGISRRDFVLVFAGVIAGEAGTGIYDIFKGSTNYPVVIALAVLLTMLFTLLIMVIAYLVLLTWEKAHPRKSPSQAPPSLPIGQNA